MNKLNENYSLISKAKGKQNYQKELEIKKKYVLKMIWVCQVKITYIQ